MYYGRYNLRLYLMRSPLTEIIRLVKRFNGPQSLPLDDLRIAVVL